MNAILLTMIGWAQKSLCLGCIKVFCMQNHIDTNCSTMFFSLHHPFVEQRNIQVLCTRNKRCKQVQQCGFFVGILGWFTNWNGMSFSPQNLVFLLPAPLKQKSMPVGVLLCRDKCEGASQMCNVICIHNIFTLFTTVKRIFARLMNMLKCTKTFCIDVQF